MADSASASASSVPASKLPVFLPPASPTWLLSYIIAQHVYPATLIIGSSKQDFLRALASDAETNLDTAETRTLLAASLFQTAVAKHIRVVFVPTVSHLRAHLAVFSPHDSPVPPPPPAYAPSSSAHHAAPGLIVYGFLDLHRESSEWNAQGVMRSLSAVVDGASRTGFSPVLVEPLLSAAEKEDNSLEKLVAEEVPLLGYKKGGHPRLSKRTIPLSRIIQRWFRLAPVACTEMTNITTEPETQDHDHASQEDAAMIQADE